MCLKNLENNSLKNYGLFPSHDLRAPSLSLDAMLKITKVKLPDPEMYIFFEKVQEVEFLILPTINV